MAYAKRKVKNTSLTSEPQTAGNDCALERGYRLRMTPLDDCYRSALKWRDLIQRATRKVDVSLLDMPL